MPSKAVVARYWSERQEIEVDYELPSCFACGWSPDWYRAVSRRGWGSIRLERCHIIPFRRGGASTPENLVLLCARCHQDAPMFNHSVTPMLEWINRREGWVPYLCRSLCQECERLSPGIFERLSARFTSKSLLSVFEELLASTADMDFHPGGKSGFANSAILLQELDWRANA